MSNSPQSLQNARISTAKKEKIEALTSQFFENAGKIQYGELHLILKVHNSRIVSIVSSMQESVREAIEK